MIDLPTPGDTDRPDAGVSPAPQGEDYRLPDEDLRELAFRLGEPLKSATVRRAVTQIAGGVERLRAARTLDALRDLQLDVFEDILALEQARSALTRRLRRLGRSTKRRQMTGFALRDDQDLAEHAAITRAIWGLRRFGDSIGWRLVGFDRFYVNTLSLVPLQGFLSGKAGTAAEVRRFKESWAEGKPAVLHGITTAFRTGDISVYDGARWMPHEVKSDESHLRGGGRQAALLSARTRLLTVGEETRPDGTRLVHVTVARKFEHDLDILREALEESVRTGAGARRIEPRAMVIATDLERQAELGVETATAQMQQAWTSVWAPIKKGVRGRSEDRQAASRFGIPYTSFPFPPEICARLACGYLRVVTVLDLARVAQALELAGLSAAVTYQRPGGADGPWLRVQRGARGLHVPGTYGERLLFELMRPSSLAALIIDMLSDPLRFDAALTIFPSFENESEVWS